MHLINISGLAVCNQAVFNCLNPHKEFFGETLLQSLDLGEHCLDLVLGHLVSLRFTIVDGCLLLKLSLKLIYLFALFFGYLLDRRVATQLIVVSGEYLMFLL